MSTKMVMKYSKLNICSIWMILTMTFDIHRQRIPKHHVFYYRSPVHQNHYVLSFAFAFDKEDEIFQFAIAPPYSFSRLQAYLTALNMKFSGKFVRSVLGQSLVSKQIRFQIVIQCMTIFE